MLKSTYRAATSEASTTSLPEGWTEHKAPTGHIYYYNAETKHSTYTRPVVEDDEPLQIDYNATQADPVIRASMKVLDDFHKNNDQRGHSHFTGGRSYQERSRRGNQGDRPKTKAAIPNCAPWVLVKTKMERRFVHNTETKQSLWKFPGEVMMAVIEMDRLEWEMKKKVDTQQMNEIAEKPAASAAEGVEQPDRFYLQDPYDSESYEEIEVTDDEGEEGDDPSSKRPRISPSRPPPPPGPVEFDEDDIAWQLAQMEGDEDTYAGKTCDEGADEGLPITEEDSVALFRSILDDFHINPYSTFERVIEDNVLVEDPRYSALPNTSRRREVFLNWSRDRVAELQARKKIDATKLTDPKIAYLRFLHAHASPKLYWPEFKRKFKKEPELRDFNLSDKDREKLYREYLAKLKLSEGDRRKELVLLLKSVDVEELNRQSTLDELPEVLLRDLRFILLPQEKRDELVLAHVATLPDA